MVSCEEVGLCQRNLICTNFIYAWSSRLERNVFSIPHNNFTDTQKSKESSYDMDNRENNFCIFSHMNSLTDEDDSWSEKPELTWQIQLEMKGPSIGIEGLQLNQLLWGNSGKAAMKAIQKSSRPHIQLGDCFPAILWTNQNWTLSAKWAHSSPLSRSKVEGSGRYGNSS